MSVKTPSFWYPKDAGSPAPLLQRLLRPASWIYGVVFKAHQASKRAQKVDIPVVCIGNITAGGTGKTPSAIAILAFIRDAGYAKNPYFLLRGYGGGAHGPLVVNADAHTAWDVGDEALILARYAPTIVSADRVAGANLALQNGADMVVMDDGLQNPGIHKDINIVVVNGEMGFGNGLLMPAGPLREPLSSGFEKADGFLLIGEDASHSCALFPDGKPVIAAHLKADEDRLPDKGQKYIAFAGLGYPQKFFDFLTGELGYDIVDAIAFADHCPYERHDLQALHQKARDAGALLLTTEKDYLRLPKGYKDDIFTIPVAMHIDTPDILDALLKDMTA